MPAWFNRGGWQRLPFGAFADSINERVEPADASDEIYVGLDDLDPGSLHIRRWGKGSDVIGTKLRFRKGDTIFGRRRAYQRKLVVAEMDGICSAHAMVVRAKPDVVLPRFLPFLMMSDTFMNRAVEISVGSLSPTINWTTLKLEEFDLPPLDQQRRIAEILWAVDEEEQQKIKVAADARGLLTAELEEDLNRLFDGHCERLENILLGSPESGSSAPPSPTETGHYVLSLAALSRSGYLRGKLKPIPPTKAMLDCRLGPGDFLISRSNTQDLVGLVGIFNEDRNDVSFPDTMMRLPVDETWVSKRFLEAVLQSRRGRLHMMRSAAGTSGSMKKINRRTLGTCLIPTPALKIQEFVLNKIHVLREATDSANSVCCSANVLKHALLECILGRQP
ncbi:MAG: restriction endonuclease subunit S [Armatimonadota bacterium]|nr:restriction endonuclease subunit S [Armatimonadota bacterium]